MESGKTPRMEGLESGRQEIQGKIAGLTKGKGITDDPGLQREPTSWKGNTDPSITPRLNNHGEQKKLRKNSFGRSEHINVQQ